MMVSFSHLDLTFRAAMASLLVGAVGPRAAAQAAGAAGAAEAPDASVNAADRAPRDTPREAAPESRAAPRFGDIGIGPGLRQPIDDPDDPAAADLDRPTLLDPFPGTRRGGVYGRIGGLVIEPQENGRLEEGGEVSEVTFDRGYGFNAAIGHHFGDVPVSLEVEYAYRNIATDEVLSPGGPRIADGDLDLHTFSLNLLLDAPDLISIVGVYAGGGVGIVASEMAVRSRSGRAAVAVRSEDVFLQAMAGLTVSVGYSAQLYGGLRWSTAGRIEDERDMLSVDTEMVAAEFGLRYFF